MLNPAKIVRRTVIGSVIVLFFISRRIRKREKEREDKE